MDEVDVSPSYSPDGLPAAVQHPKPIVVIGAWLLLGPTAIALPVSMLTSFAPERFIDWFAIAVLLGVEFGCWVLLFFVTRNFVRNQGNQRRA